VFQRFAQGGIYGGMRLLADLRLQPGVVEAERDIPQVAHFLHFPEYLDEGRGTLHQPPGKGFDASRVEAGQTANYFRHVGAALEPMPAEVEHLKIAERAGAFQ
jgi:hypothetical protein